MSAPSSLRSWTLPKVDARYFQILYLGSFLVLGTFFLGWDTSPLKLSGILLTALLVQGFFIGIGKADKSSWMSALITGLGLCLLFRANSVYVLMFGSSLAISSKFLFKLRGKHLFNPANIGIIGTLLITNDGWISPGQWGSSIIFLFVLGVLGSVLLFKVGRLDTTLTFLLTFVVLEYSRTVLYLGWSSDVLLHKLSSGSFVLFAFFMITDPKTSPDHPRARLIWAFSIALLAFILSNWAFIHTAPIWALFFITPITAICDTYWKAERFQWTKEKNLNPI
ncbi:MAG: RnfABCDGE type electron transport complex subunit D [Bacteroidetes bacterium]|nr:RnfABCDGE type electron transport complex subunit D [Bacteroidota bacterium]